MNKSSTFILIAFCVVLAVGYINARIADPLPQGFMDDCDCFALEPKQVITLEHNKILFKFGDETNRMYHSFHILGLFSIPFDVK